MATPEGFNGNTIAEGGFVQFLESCDLGLELDDGHMYPSSFAAEKAQKMLCFGNNRSEVVMSFPKSGVAAGDSSSTSPSSGNSSSKSRKAEKGEEKNGQKKRSESVNESLVPGTNADRGWKTCKKNKTEQHTASAAGPLRVRKEKLGERITTLQQLVSPFGKTDTASVLHEAMGYISFLHHQVQVLSFPYLQRLLSSASLPKEETESRYDLRSRGLCLVPVACTTHVANSNGADFWSPAAGSKNYSDH